MFKQHLLASPVGTVQQVVVRDNTERVYSYRALAEFPLVVSVGVSLTDALADWRARVVADAVLLAVVSGALFGGAVAMSRALARRETAEAALADSARRTAAIVEKADVLRELGRRGAQRDANAHREGDLFVPDRRWLREHVAKALGHPFGDVGGVAALYEHGEFVAPEPCDGGILTGGLSQTLANGGEQLIAHAMSEPLVHGAEIIDVEKEHRDEILGGHLQRQPGVSVAVGFAEERGAIESEAQSIEKDGTIGKAGEHVVVAVETHSTLIGFVLRQ